MWDYSKHSAQANNRHLEREIAKEQEREYYIAKVERIAKISLESKQYFSTVDRRTKDIHHTLTKEKAAIKKTIANIRTLYKQAGEPLSLRESVQVFARSWVFGLSPKQAEALVNNSYRLYGVQITLEDIYNGNSEFRRILDEIKANDEYDEAYYS